MSNNQETTNSIEIQHGIKVIDLPAEQETSKATKQKSQKHKGQVSTKFKDLNRYVVAKLNNKHELRKEWILVGVLTAFSTVFFGVLLGIMQFFSGRTVGNPAIYNAQYLNEAMRIMSILSFALLSVPYIYMGGAFLSGINQIHKSKTVHYLIWSTFIINALMIVICSCLLIAGYYGLTPDILMSNFTN